MITAIEKIQKNQAVLQCFVVAYCIILVCLFVIPSAFAADYSFTWSANPEPVEGYKFHYKKGGVAGPPFDGTGSLKGPSPVNVGEKTVFTITGLEDNTTYYFALTAYNGTEESGFSDIIPVFAPAVAVPVAVIVTTAQEGEAPFSVNFNGASSTGTINSYSWTFGDGDSATGSSVAHVYQLPGTYTATLTVENASGSSQASTVIIVTAPVLPPPVPPTNPTAVISSSSTVGSAPYTVQFDGSASTATQPPIVSYSWSFGDGAIAGGASVSHIYTTPGTYQVVLTVCDNVGLTDQVSLPVIISAAPTQENQPPVSSFSVTPNSGIAPLKVSFNGSGSSDQDGSISEYLWTFGDGSTASGISLQHTFTASANYTVTLRVMDDHGKTATSSQMVSVLKRENVKPTKKNDVTLPLIYLLLLK